MKEAVENSGGLNSKVSESMLKHKKTKQKGRIGEKRGQGEKEGKK
jgi:hypothetical protein